MIGSIFGNPLGLYSRTSPQTQEQRLAALENRLWMLEQEVHEWRTGKRVTITFDQPVHLQGHAEGHNVA